MKTRNVEQCHLLSKARDFTTCLFHPHSFVVGVFWLCILHPENEKQRLITKENWNPSSVLALLQEADDSDVSVSDDEEQPIHEENVRYKEDNLQTEKVKTGTDEGSSVSKDEGSSRSTGEVQRFRSWESPLYQLVKTGLKMFDVSSPVKLQDYLTYLAYQMDSAGLLRRKEEKIPGVIMQETSKPGLLRRKEEKTPGVVMQETSKLVQESPSVKHFRDTMDDNQLREFVAAHVKEGAWQVVMLFWDELLHRDSKDDDEDAVSGDLKSRKLTWWPTDEDHYLRILLKVLTKEKRKLTDEGAKHIAEALTIGYGCPYNLDLSWKDVTDEGVKHIAEALSSSHCRLKRLNLDGNKVTDEGVKHIAEALSSSHCRLESLDLDCNELTDEGVKHIAEALSNTYCRLKVLFLSGNDNITDRGLTLLAKALVHSNYELKAKRPSIIVRAKRPDVSRRLELR